MGIYGEGDDPYDAERNFVTPESCQKAYLAGGKTLVNTHVIYRYRGKVLVVLSACAEPISTTRGSQAELQRQGILRLRRAGGGSLRTKIEHLYSSLARDGVCSGS